MSPLRSRIISVFVVGALAAFALSGPTPTQAASVTFNLGTSFNGTAPAGSPPWIQATFNDIAGGIELTLTALNLSSTEFMSQFTFNIDPFVATTLSLVSGVADSAYTTSLNCCVAGSGPTGGLFDARINYPVSNSNPTLRFAQGDSSVFDISGTGFSVANVLATSIFQNGPNDGKPTPFFVAAKIQGITSGTDSNGNACSTTNTCSGDIASTTPVPLPPALVLFGSGLAGLGFLTRRRRNKQMLAAV